MLNSSLSHLIHYYNINKRGLCALIGVPVEGVTSMPDAKTLMASPVSETNSDFFFEEIVLADGFEWLDLSQLFNVNMEFTEEEKYTAQNSMFEYEVSLSVPNDDYATRGKIFRAYQNREFILVAKERSGAWRVIGSLERGAKFTASLETGTVRKGSNIHTCGFTWQTGEQRAFYTEAFPLDDYFEITGLINDMSVDVFIIINETVYIVWGDGTAEIAHGQYLLNNLIAHTYVDGISADPYTYRVYHRNTATSASAPALGAYNGTVDSISGTLPPVTAMDMSDNTMDEAAIIAALGLLNTANASNGTADFRDQTPAVPGSPAITTAKAPLLLKGWTVLH